MKRWASRGGSVLWPAFFASLMVVGGGCATFPQGGKAVLSNPDAPVRIGFFYGARTNMLYRAYQNDFFSREGVRVKFLTKFLNEEELMEVPKTHEEKMRISTEKYFGKLTGVEIAEMMSAGECDGGLLGESSFVAAVSNGHPLVAVAGLGYFSAPGKAIVMRSDVQINSPEDFKGKTLISRRAGPGDAMMLREFLKDIGLQAGEDVTVIDQVDEEHDRAWLREKKIDGGLYHLMTTRLIVLEGIGYVYRLMDWMKPELSQAVLVFHKTYLQEHPEKVQRFVNAYVKRIAYERDLPPEHKDGTWEAGLIMEGDFQGLRPPSFDLPPTVKVGLLEEIQVMLMEHGFIKRTVTIDEFVDQSFVEKAMNSL